LPKKKSPYPKDNLIKENNFLTDIYKSKKIELNVRNDLIVCQNCGYKIIRPYPKDQLCPRCDKFLTNLYEHKVENDESKPKVIKEFGTRTSTPSRKFGAKVQVKEKKDEPFSISDDFIPLRQGNEYIRFLGITTKKGRNKLFFSNDKFKYLLELANNLDYIATSILEGELDKMLLISDKGVKEKCQFYVKDNLIYIVFGNFPDKKGKWILEQMAKYFAELIDNKDVDALIEAGRHDINIERKFNGPATFIIKEYKQLQEVFTDKEIPYLEDWMRVDYLGLSSMSIGVISLLLDEKGNLSIEVPGEYENESEEIEMKESLLTAKIEAIAANTLGNTGSYPRWIAVKLGFQKYRFLTFKKYQNDYFLSLLSEGNLQKLDKVESIIEPYLYHAIDKPFSGNLRPFNKLKATVKEILNKFPSHKIN